MRPLLISILIAFAAAPLAAQQVPVERFPRTPSVSDTANVESRQPELREKKRRPAPVAGQFFAGMAGMLVVVR